MKFAKINSFILICICLLISGCKRKRVTQDRLCSRVDLEQITKIIPKSSEEIYLATEQMIASMNEMLQDIECICPEKRTYVNTLLAYEQSYFQFFMHQQVLQLLSELSSDSAMQTAAHVALLDLKEYFQNTVLKNPIIYLALQEYEKSGKDPYRPIKPVSFYLFYKLKQAKHFGVQLSVEQRSDLQDLEESLKYLSGKYCSNLIHDQRYVVASKDELDGLSEQDLAQFLQDEYKNYLLLVDAKHYNLIMRSCKNEQIRKNYYLMYHQLGYPTNQSVLSDFVTESNQYARMLGCSNFADWQLDMLMTRYASKALSFINHMIKDLQPYLERDFAKLTFCLPSGMHLTSDKKIQPWDFEYVLAEYKKNHFAIDDAQVAQYFPLKHVLPTLLTQMSKFYHVVFEPQKDCQVWGSDVLCYRVRSLKHQSVIGYLFFDLYQRSAKYHCSPHELSVIPAIRDDCSLPCVGATAIVASFEKDLTDQPTLLTFADLQALFYQFGTAMHTLFGATRFTEFSGNQVMYDFSMVAGKTLALWLTDAAFVQSLSSHKDTKKPLSKVMITQLLAREKCGKSFAILQELFKSLIALELFEQHQTNIHAMIEKWHKKIFKHIAYCSDDYFELSFPPFVDSLYACAYYRNVWSQVIAADLFDYIHNHGLLNSDIGMKYVTDILSFGGSKYPLDLLKKFLGRSFHKKAFFEQL